MSTLLLPLTTSLLLLGLLTTVTHAAEASKNAVPGIKCSKNQVVNKVTVYEDGAIEAECGPMPCGTAGERCVDEQSSCRADTDTFSGMKWAPNGQSLALRCCSAVVPSKIYVGTDLVTLGSYYTGGLVAKKDMYGKEPGSGPEYDYVVNVRTEQGGVRVWVYRIMCPQVSGGSSFSPVIEPSSGSSSTSARPFDSNRRREEILKQMAANQDAQSVSVQAQDQHQHVPQVARGTDSQPAAVEEPSNPLQYRPRTPATAQRQQRQQAQPQQSQQPLRLL